MDVGILPARRLSVQEKVEVAQALEALFRVNLVDLVVIPEADPFLAANIVRGKHIYARDSYLADEYNFYILRRAGDLAALERERMQRILTQKFRCPRKFPTVWWQIAWLGSRTCCPISEPCHWNCVR